MVEFRYVGDSVFKISETTYGDRLMHVSGPGLQREGR
jgi:hypothetical protein